VTLGMAFSNAGGFMTVVFMITAIIVQRMQSTIYFTQLIKSFYKYQEETPKETKKSKNKHANSHRDEIS
jgi:uncharacterized membrane protein YhiD involved in acid resistance